MVGGGTKNVKYTILHLKRLVTVVYTNGKKRVGQGFVVLYNCEKQHLRSITGENF